jgi:[protein-PII] uridylyltransferase
MDGIVEPRLIVNRRELELELRAISDSAGLDPIAARPLHLARLKTALETGRAEIRRRFEAANDGRIVVRGTTYLIDQLVRLIHDLGVRAYFPANPTSGEEFSVIAVGGYGRSELAPFSDIDLLVLRRYKASAAIEQVVEYMLYMLWDLGLKVGHATRSLPECIRLAKSDITIRTALLEARWVWGDQTLMHELKSRFRAEFDAGSGPSFVEAKLAERDERHRRLGDSRYVLEPNVKEGKGGLRDLQTLFWIAKYLYGVDRAEEVVDRGVLTPEEARRFDKAQTFLWTVRCHLHYFAGRAEERLTFDAQTEIGRRMGYTTHAGSSRVERFMKHYFLVAKEIGDLTRIFCAALEARHEKTSLPKLLRLGRRLPDLAGFRLQNGRLSVPDDALFLRDPRALLRIFHVAQQHDLAIHPRALRLVTQSAKTVAQLREDREANRMFLDILTSNKEPEGTLRLMNEAGVFGRFVPDFGRVVAQMQYDMYHVYTVDEHTIFAIGILHKIEKGELAEELPLATEIVKRVASRRVLYLGLLLHDIAKGRGGDHSILGAEVARRLAPRLGLDADETETVAWLVEYHLLLSNTAFKRDVSDPKTVADFIGRVQSLERLRLLLVLTVADIRAVGPHVWNNWKATLLRNLYLAAEAEMTGEKAAGPRDSRVAAILEELRAELADWSPADLATHAGRGDPSYWLAFDRATLVRHAQIVRESERRGAPLTVDHRVDRQRGVTEIVIYCGDHPGLFSRIAGAIALAGGSIVDARIFTLANGMALDTFWVQDAEGGPFERPDKLAVAIERALAGRIDLNKELALKRPAWPKRADVFTVTPRVTIDNKASNTQTLIEIVARDRPGLLYDVTRTLTSVGLQISSARISTFGERAVDVFYVRDLFGMKVDHDAKLGQIRDRLLHTLALPVAASNPAPAPTASAPAAPAPTA